MSSIPSDRVMFQIIPAKNKMPLPKKPSFFSGTRVRRPISHSETAIPT